MVMERILERHDDVGTVGFILYSDSADKLYADPDLKVRLTVEEVSNAFLKGCVVNKGGILSRPASLNADGSLSYGGSSQKLYRHDICLWSDAWTTASMIEVCISFVNTDPTSYEKFADFDAASGDMITPFTADDFSFLPSGEIMATGYVADSSGSDSSIVFCCSKDSYGVGFRGVYLDDCYFYANMPFEEFECIYDTVTEVM